MALVTVQRSPTGSEAPQQPKPNELNRIPDDCKDNRNPKSLSECYFAGKGTALVLPDATEAATVQKSTPISGAGGGNGGGGTRFGQAPEKAGPGLSTNIQTHLQSMFYLLRPEETLKMAVKLESAHSGRTRYLVVVSRMGERNSEESCLLGIDCNEKTTVGLVLKVLANTSIRLDGDGGFSVTVCERNHIFKPVSVQAMWSALQTLHKVSAKAREQNYFQGGSTHAWAGYYEARIESERSCLNEWDAMDSLESRRPPSPDSVRLKPTEREQTERVIRTTLKEIMMSVDLDEVTSKVIRTRLEEDLDMDLAEYKSFIDQEMLVILGQMDAPTEVFDHVYLGSEWNASNYEELQRNGVGHILNVTREIDNFFPGTFDYLNIRVYDDEKTDLLKHWDDTFKYITKARDKGSKVLVHCKMGVSRSASVVIAYAMKAYNWDFATALQHVRDKRSCIKPNTSFLSQLETYQGILDAMKNREKLQRSKSETNLKSPGRAKTGDKVLPGSEPTPLVQALSYDMHNTGEDLKQIGARPKSWSPDNLPPVECLHSSKSSPVFLSLNNLSQGTATSASSKECSKDADTPSFSRHVVMPCDNGESYSVSPNQIVHLSGHNTDLLPASVRDRIAMDRCNGHKKRLVLNLSKKFTEAGDFGQPQWDPGESARSTKALDKSTTQQAKASDGCDSGVCGGEGRVWTASTSLVKSVTNQSAVSVVHQLEERPSRQNSWGSYDSAVVLSYQSDTGDLLSRQNSWGSTDTATKTLLSRNSSWGSYDMRARPAEAVNSTLIAAIDEHAASKKSQLIDIPADDAHCPANCTAQHNARLSISAPEQSSMDLIQQQDSLSRSDCHLPTGSVKQHKTFLEKLHKEATSGVVRQMQPEKSAGKVRNLKKEFEAKSDHKQQQQQSSLVQDNEAVRCKNRLNTSLPASPVIGHHQQPKEESINVLIDIFESRDDAQQPVNLRPKTLGKQRTNSRHSCIEMQPQLQLKKPLAPVVRNNPQLVATVIATAAKKQQQYGKSHPLARLNIKPRHNNPVYNTM